MPKPWIAEFGAGGLWRASQVELEPVGWAMGNVVLTPVITGKPFNSAEVSDASLFIKKGWETAILRMREDAQKQGAQGVVSVRLIKKEFDEENKIAEFCAVGTAVRGLPGPLLWATQMDPCEIAMLVEQGYAPVALAVGCCTWHQSSYGWKTKGNINARGFRGLPNQEVTPATEAAYTARAVAMQRVQEAARKAGATGVIDTKIFLTHAHCSDPMTGFTFGIEASATGIVSIPGRRQSLDVKWCIPLDAEHVK